MRRNVIGIIVIMLVAAVLAPRAQQAMDGALGGYLRAEMAARGIFGFPVAAFDNGMRHIAGTLRPTARPDDLTSSRVAG